MTTPHPTTWRKSTYSADASNCVELADVDDAVLVRDSKHPDGGHLTVTAPELTAFVASVKAGRFDHLA